MATGTTRSCRLGGKLSHVIFARRLSHESPTTTHQYVEADLAMKEKALSRLQEPNVAARRFRADDSLLAFLKTL